MPNVAILHVGQLKIQIEPFVFGLNLHFVAFGKCGFKSK